MARKAEGQKERKICECGKRPVAINYKKNGITHYRSVCSTCSKERRRRSRHPNYRKKHVCEKCGFKPTFKEQLDVFVDEQSDTIKTVCLNCKEELVHTKTWKQGDLIADF